jgi:hypothetical protein
MTAAMRAVECGSGECLSLLLCAGCDIHAMNEDGWSALALAGARDGKKAVEILWGAYAGREAEFFEQMGKTPMDPEPYRARWELEALGAVADMGKRAAGKRI